MKAEIIAVGTELLMGYIINTNASDIAQGLLDIGIGTYYQSVVGDNKERIKESLEIASSRSDLIVLSGGLGPTDDDITKFVLADYLGEELFHDSNQLEMIESYFKNQNREITENNYRQALTISGGKTLNNNVGLSAGVIYTKKVDNKDKYYIVLPGPPFEMQHMLDEQVKPFIKNAVSDQGVITSKYINLYGVGESFVADTLDDLVKTQTNPTIAIYAKPKRVTVRLTSNSKNYEQSLESLDSVSEVIRKRFSNNFIGFGSNQTLEKYIIDELTKQKKTLSAAESLTGGLVLEKLTNTPGAGEVIKGGFVTYQTNQKEKILGISKELIEKYSVVSAEVAISMAEKTLTLTESDIAISLTGVAGPSSLEGHPPGEVFIALATNNHPTKVTQLNISNKPRHIVREVAEFEVLNLVREFLNK
ncbi:competence/damage-inducible protein A [Aerococcaceae bacterium DSM 111021]|nr:competence/damage-inducible protein A [Aerococcaceae bacterium DSM 111021]